MIYLKSIRSNEVFTLPILARLKFHIPNFHPQLIAIVSEFALVLEVRIQQSQAALLDRFQRFDAPVRVAELFYAST